jgi:hypothetical protein
MPPFKKIPKTEAAAAAQGLASMTSFFSAKKSPGRPAKKTPKSGHPAAEKAPAPAAAQEAAAVTPKAKKPKATRTSYSKGEGLMKITNAEVHDIPFTALQTHITPNDSKRIKLGSGVGRKPVLDDQREAIIFDMLSARTGPTKARAWVKPPTSSSKFAPSISASSSTKKLSGAPCGRITVSA